MEYSVFLISHVFFHPYNLINVYMCIDIHTSKPKRQHLEKEKKLKCGGNKRVMKENKDEYIFSHVLSLHSTVCVYMYVCVHVHVYNMKVEEELFGGKKKTGWKMST